MSDAQSPKTPPEGALIALTALRRAATEAQKLAIETDECIDIDLLKFQKHPAYNVITRVMLILSDLQKSDIGLLNSITPEMQHSEKRSILMYYMKGQISILEQSLELYKKFKMKNLDHFRNLKDDLFDPQEDENMIDELVDDKWKLYIKDIRDKISHHYDEDMINFVRREGFLEKRKFSTIKRGETMYDWKFYLAEEITEDYILELAPNKYGISMTREKIVIHLNNIRDAFLNYYGDMVWLFFSKLNADKN